MIHVHALISCAPETVSYFLCLLVGRKVTWTTLKSSGIPSQPINSSSRRSNPGVVEQLERKRTHRAKRVLVVYISKAEIIGGGDLSFRGFSNL